MSYNQNIPIGTDDLSVSQPQIQSNFFAIYNAFNLNHVPFNTPDGTQGKHMFVEMPNQNAAPPATIANETGLYCNTSTYTAQPELFFIKQNGTTAPAPLNGANGYEITSSNYVANVGWTRLPSGIMLMWGLVQDNSHSTQTFILPVNATTPNYNAIYQILLSGTGLAGQIYTLGTVTQPTQSPLVGGKFVVINGTSGAGSLAVTFLVIGV
jgi:hypothetical protein